MGIVTKKTSVRRNLGLLTALTLTLLNLLAGCGGGGSNSEPGGVEFTFDFSQGSQGWIAGASDYPVAYESQMNIATGIADLPAPLDQNRTAYHLAGQNYSDDLFLYLTKPITGLKPNFQYSLMFHVSIASNASPLNVMYLKAGATITEPERVVAEVGGSPYYLMNINKGNQAQSGTDAVVIGTNVPVSDSGTWQLKTVDSPAPFVVRTDQNGAVWLLVGGECTFEVWNEIYYTNIRVVATPA